MNKIRAEYKTKNKNNSTYMHLYASHAQSYFRNSHKRNVV